MIKKKCTYIYLNLKKRFILWKVREMSQSPRNCPLFGGSVREGFTVLYYLSGTRNVNLMR